MLYIYAGRPSNSAKLLARELKVKRLRESTNLFARDNTEIINWGSSVLPEKLKAATVINTPAAVRESANKLMFFDKMRGIKVENKAITPKHTQDVNEAKDWIRKNGGAVVCRTILNGSGGRGIVIAAHEEELVNAPLYVRYIPKKNEYRVHIVD